MKSSFKIKLLIDTDLRLVLHKILGFQSTQEELYFLKLETIWIYINFSLDESDVVEYILQEVDLSPNDSDQEVLSHLIGKLDTLIASDIMNESGAVIDFKLLHNVLNLLGNIGYTGKLEWR